MNDNQFTRKSLIRSLFFQRLKQLPLNSVRLQKPNNYFRIELPSTYSAIGSLSSFIIVTDCPYTNASGQKTINSIVFIMLRLLFQRHYPVRATYLDG